MQDESHHVQLGLRLKESRKESSNILRNERDVVPAGRRAAQLLLNPDKSKEAHRRRRVMPRSSSWVSFVVGFPREFVSGRGDCTTYLTVHCCRSQKQSVTKHVQIEPVSKFTITARIEHSGHISSHALRKCTPRWSMPTQTRSRGHLCDGSPRSCPPNLSPLGLGKRING